MRIKEITYQSRRDFKAKFICPHCGYEEEKWGYDDNYFHQKVIKQLKDKLNIALKQIGEIDNK